MLRTAALLELAAAVQICEKLAPKSAIKIFNPNEVTLLGAKEPGRGSWTFFQREVGGKVYQIVVYFPQKKCIIIDFR